MSAKKIKCSVPLLTLNAQAHLEECLESVKDFEDVFLLDGNSTDNTHAIARSRNIPVYKQVETDEPNVRIKHFSEMRLKAQRLARYDWILVLDSDEFISGKLTDEIRNALESSDMHRVFTMPKVAIMGKRVVRYSFNTPDYAPRMYNRASGAIWKSSKFVHEKLYIPEHVRAIKFSGEFYGYAEARYKEALKKDNYYLSLTHKKIFSADPKTIHKRYSFSSFWINLARAGNVLFKSLKVYARHGFKESLPIQHVWRFVRYHVIISYYRFKELFIK